MHKFCCFVHLTVGNHNESNDKLSLMNVFCTYVWNHLCIIGINISTLRMDQLPRTVVLYHFSTGVLIKEGCSQCGCTDITKKSSYMSVYSALYWSWHIHFGFSCQHFSKNPGQSIQKLPSSCVLGQLSHTFTSSAEVCEGRMIRKWQTAAADDISMWFLQWRCCCHDRNLPLWLLRLSV